MPEIAHPSPVQHSLRRGSEATAWCGLRWWTGSRRTAAEGLGVGRWQYRKRRVLEPVHAVDLGPGPVQKPLLDLDANESLKSAITEPFPAGVRSALPLPSRSRSSHPVDGPPPIAATCSKSQWPPSPRRGIRSKMTAHGPHHPRHSPSNVGHISTRAGRSNGTSGW